MISLKNYKKITDDFIEKEKKWLKPINSFLIKYFKWLVVLIVLTILTLGSWFLLWPKYQEVRYLLEISKQQQEDVFLQRQERLEILEGIIDSYNSISETDLEKIKLILPERKNKEEVFTELKELVAENNLILRNVSIEGEKEAEQRQKEENREIVTRSENDTSENNYRRNLPEGVERIRVSLFIVGTNYNSLRSLLNTLEKNLTLMDIVRIDFSPKGNTTSLILDTYQLK